MGHRELIQSLASAIAAVRRSHPTRVAIDGVDASGKTTLADVRPERWARPEEFPRVSRFYSETQYTGRLSPLDRIIVAEHAEQLVGAARLAREEGVLVLRGMRVAAPWQRRGVGTRMLEPLEALRERCFCIPHSHLVAFYAAAGFATTSDGPAFLQERLTEYRSRGLDVCLMVREPRVASRPSA